MAIVRIEDHDLVERWLEGRIAAGISITDVINEMLAKGYSMAESETFVARFGRARLPIRLPVYANVGLAESNNGFVIDGMAISVLFSSTRPHAMLLKGFLSDAECDALIALSRDRLLPSTVVTMDADATRGSGARTSGGMGFLSCENELIVKIENRIAAVTSLQAHFGERIQVLCYGVGGRYVPHFDFFNAGHAPGLKEITSAGQRIATIIMYLNTVEAGGETDFPVAGLSVAPVKGNALIFSNVNCEGLPDEYTLHAGRPVLRGEKWIATKWLRERDVKSNVKP